MKQITSAHFLWLLLILSSAIVGCGSSESIKSYRYQIPKDELEKAVFKVINNNPHINLDTMERKVLVRRHPNDNSDTTTMMINVEDYTGKEKADLLHYYSSMTKIKIKDGQTENTYVFKYGGDAQNWKTSTSSTIFISEAHDNNGNSLSQGHNDQGQFKSKAAKAFTDLFETELVNKLDKELNLQHSVD